ncbi:MAG: carboxypeptidase regulatory-like domain-containing protein [Candidatus Altiarchaeota archaeon]|nr:carboxypeptidase regulatory-like domain-containing protein [Candidatus Altiarchaeota archaeon]
MPCHKLAKTAVICLGVVLVTLSVGAANLKHLSTDPEDVEYECRFRITTLLDGNTCGMQVKFYIDDALIDSKSVGCARDVVESSEFNPSRDNIACGYRILKAELLDKGVVIDNITKEKVIGNRPLINIEEKPLVNNEFTIHFEDAEGDPVDGIAVKIYNIRNGRKSAQEYSSDSGGNITFKSREVGDYHLLIEDSDYCGDTNFSVKKTLNIDGPHPANPLTGELISIAVPTGVGVKVYSEDGNQRITCNTSLGGGANFTIDRAGNYTLVIGEINSMYWGRNISLYVRERLAPEFETIPPDNIVRGKELRIKVTAQEPIPSGTRITVKSPAGDAGEFETDAEGVIRYTPSVRGSYTLNIINDNYKASEGSFEVRDLLKINTGSERNTIGEDIVLQLEDQFGNPVAGAIVSAGSDIRGLSGLDGRYAFKVSEPGTCVINAEKEGYWSAEKGLDICSPITLELGSGLVEIGSALTIKALDWEGSLLDAEIYVTGPDGTGTQAQGVYTPERAGTYQVTASKEGYITASTEFIASAHPLELDVSLDGNRLNVVATSNGLPVQGIPVALDGSGVAYGEGYCDDEGLAFFDITREGLFTVVANSEGINPEYLTASAEWRITKRHDASTLLMAVAVVVLIGVAAAGTVYTLSSRGAEGKRPHHRTKSADGKKKPESHFKKGGGSRLSRV